nr:hypothetical protein [Tanacetum cinerariifolium]
MKKWGYDGYLQNGGLGMALLSVTATAKGRVGNGLGINLVRLRKKARLTR